MSRQSTGILSPMFRKILRAIEGKDYDQDFSLPGAFYMILPGWKPNATSFSSVTGSVSGGLKRYRKREIFSTSITSANLFLWCTAAMALSAQCQTCAGIVAKK